MLKKFRKWLVKMFLFDVYVPYNLVFLCNVCPGFFLWNVGEICAKLVATATGYYQKTNRFKTKIAEK